MTPRSVKRAEILRERRMLRAWRQETRHRRRVLQAAQDKIRNDIARQLTYFDQQFPTL